MTRSIQEEIICALWAICAVLSFGFDFTVWGWIFTVKAVMDNGAAIYCAIKEAIIELRNK